MDDLKLQLTELVEQVESHFGRNKTEKMSRAEFAKFRDDILKEVPNMDELTKTHPFYAAVGFLGKIEYDDCEEIKAFSEKPSAALLAKLREKKAIRVASTARPSWDHLVKSNETALLTILALCYLAYKNPVVKNALKKS